MLSNVNKFIFKIKNYLLFLKNIQQQSIIFLLEKIVTSWMIHCNVVYDILISEIPAT